MITTRGAARRSGLALLGAVVAGILAALPAILSGELLAKILPAQGRQISNFVRYRIAAIVRSSLDRVGWFGLGTGGFSHLARMGDHRFYPHNLVAELWLENGVLGLIVLLAFVGSALALWLRWGRGIRPTGERQEIRTLQQGVGMLFLYSFLIAQFSGDIAANEWVWLWGGALLAWGGRCRSTLRRRHVIHHAAEKAAITGWSG